MEIPKDMINLIKEYVNTKNVTCQTKFGSGSSLLISIETPELTTIIKCQPFYRKDRSQINEDKTTLDILLGDLLARDSLKTLDLTLPLPNEYLEYGPLVTRFYVENQRFIIESKRYGKAIIQEGQMKTVLFKLRKLVNLTIGVYDHGFEICQACMVCKSSWCMKEAAEEDDSYNNDDSLPWER